MVREGNCVKKLVRACGFDVRRRRWTPQHFARLIDARTVVDIGVAFGTWELYRAFPDAHAFRRSKYLAPQDTHSFACKYGSSAKTK